MAEGEVSFIRTEGLLKGILALVIIVVLTVVAVRFFSSSESEDSTREMKTSLLNFRVKFKLIDVEEEEMTVRGLYLDKDHIFQFFGEKDKDKPRSCTPALVTEEEKGCICLCSKPSDTAKPCPKYDEVVQCFNLNYDVNRETIKPRKVVTETVPMNCKISFRDKSGIPGDKIYVYCQK